MYCPLAIPNILIPIQAAATSPVPTWKSRTQTYLTVAYDNIFFCKVKENIRKAHHGVHVCLLLCVQDGHEQGFFFVAAHHSRVEVHYVGVVVVVADVVILPPAGVSAAVRS